MTLNFETSDAAYAALIAEGRRLRAERRVVYPMGAWTDEQHARYAISHAMSEAFPQIAGIATP